MKFSQNSKFKIQNSVNGGFTLVELIVSMGIFTIVILSATGALLTMINANNKAQAVRSAMDGLGFALEDIGRSARVGWNYECLASVPLSPLSDPAFKSITTDLATCSPSGAGSPGVKIKMDIGTVAYYFDASSGQIKKSFKSTISSDTYSGLDLTPPDVTLTKATFYVLGDQLNDQPRILIVLSGTAGTKAGFTSTFNIETVVTARLPHAQGL